MAKIRGIEEQQEALGKVQFNIKQLKAIRDFFAIDNPSNQYEMSFRALQEHDEADEEKTVKHKKVSVKFRLSDREALKFVLSEHEEALIEEIQSLTTQYKIDLEEEEAFLLR